MTKKPNVIAAIEDLRKMKFTDDDSIKTLLKRFGRIAAKHGIKWGAPVKGGLQGATAEWAACQSFFVDRVESDLRFKILMGGIGK